MSFPEAGYREDVVREGLAEDGDQEDALGEGLPEAGDEIHHHNILLHFSPTVPLLTLPKLQTRRTPTRRVRRSAHRCSLTLSKLRRR